MLLSLFQKQSPKSIKKDAVKNFAKFTGKQPVPETF